MQKKKKKAYLAVRTPNCQTKKFDGYDKALPTVVLVVL